jgi:hypothetical protein
VWSGFNWPANTNILAENFHVSFYHNSFISQQIYLMDYRVYAVHRTLFYNPENRQQYVQEKFSQLLVGILNRQFIPPSRPGMKFFVKINLFTGTMTFGKGYCCNWRCVSSVKIEISASEWMRRN